MAIMSVNKLSFTSKNSLKVQQNRFFSYLLLQKFHGEIPQPPNERGTYPSRALPLLVPSALGERRGRSMRVWMGYND